MLEKEREPLTFYFILLLLLHVTFPLSNKLFSPNCPGLHQSKGCVCDGLLILLRKLLSNIHQSQIFAILYNLYLAAAPLRQNMQIYFMNGKQFKVENKYCLSLHNFEPV